MIGHLDMDCFYASVEMRERPELRHKPLAVGGGGLRGVVTTCNYVARAKGVRSAMPGFMARSLCPDLVFLPVRMSLYQEASKQVFEILDELAGSRAVEKTSVDEAYFEAPADPHQAWTFTQQLRSLVAERCGLSCSVGLAPNKMLAKIMSGWRKPNAQLLLRPEQVEAFMRELPVAKIPGIGPKTNERLKAEGLQSCGDLQHLSAEELAARFGHWGLQLFERCRGVDRRKVAAVSERISLSVERTLSTNIKSPEELLGQLKALHRDFAQRLSRRRPSQERGIEKAFVRFKFADFRKRSHERISHNADYPVFEQLALEAYDREPGELRLIGLGVRFDVPQKKLQDPRQLAFW